MPSTVNGVGTHYYGKSNLASRQTRCQNCQQEVVLSSYDTRLWFVVVFIPIIPLGRKRILDYCPRCTRHWALPIKDYEERRRNSLTEVLRHYEEQPSRETALAAHGAFLAFNQVQEAEQFRQATDPEDYELLGEFAVQLDDAGYADAASPLYEQLLQDHPDMKLARAGVAVRRIRAGRLDEARQLIDFLTVPGAGREHSLSPLEQLAYALEKQGRTAEAWEACTHLMRELPNLADFPTFRRFVAKLERAVVPAQSLLPPDKRSSWKRWVEEFQQRATWKVVVPVVTITLLVAALIVNEYRRRHRTLYVVNGYADSVNVTVDGGPPLTVLRELPITLAEGTHEIVWNGPSEGRQTVDVRTGYWSRWTNDPAWVLNLDGVAPLVETTVIYSTMATPSTSQGLLGETLVERPHVDYAFTQPPQQISLDSKVDQVRKLHLHVETLPIDQWADAVEAKCGPKVTQQFYESHLRRFPLDQSLLDEYVAFSRRGQQGDRGTKFLEEGLWREPISVAWHRAYQQLSPGPDSDAALRERYDKLLAAHPQSAPLLFLRGETTEDRVEALDFDRRATQADERFAWSQFNLGRALALRGDWAEARRRLDLANMNGFTHRSLRPLRNACRVALGEKAAVEMELHTAVVSSAPLQQLFGLIELCDVLAGQDRFDDVQQQSNAWFARATWALELKDQTQPLFDYLRRNDAAFEQPGALEKLNVELRIDWLLALGRTAEAAALEQQSPTDPRSPLGLACAFYFEGNRERGDAWIEWACLQLDASDAPSRYAAKLLRAESPPSEEEVAAAGMTFARQALLAAALGWKFPERRAQYFSLARRWNVSRLPPYRLVERTTRGEP